MDKQLSAGGGGGGGPVQTGSEFLPVLRPLLPHSPIPPPCCPHPRSALAIHSLSRYVKDATQAVGSRGAGFGLDAELAKAREDAFQNNLDDVQKATEWVEAVAGRPFADRRDFHGSLRVHSKRTGEAWGSRPVLSS